jgi:hypothetical protein
MSTLHRTLRSFPPPRLVLQLLAAGVGEWLALRRSRRHGAASGPADLHRIPSPPAR